MNNTFPENAVADHLAFAINCKSGVRLTASFNRRLHLYCA